MPKRLFVHFLIGAFLLLSVSALAAYHHMGEQDSPNFQETYPQKVGTMLDSCTLCHKGGSIETKPGKFQTVGSCQYCHQVYGYDGSGDITATLNQYALDYLNNGRNAAALALIEDIDSDSDGYSNIAEINAGHFPGNADDDPSKTPAPSRVYSKAQIDSLTQHSQLQIMNTHKSGDYYGTYSGVTMESFLDAVGLADDATDILTYSPDGWQQGFPMNFDQAEANNLYPVRGTYPQATFFYDEQADQAISAVGWCDYSSASIQAAIQKGLGHGDAIEVEGGLALLLATSYEGAALEPAVLNDSNKIDGEGPFRVVPPQVVIGPPDQASTSQDQDVIWPFEDALDHNAGFSPKCVTMIQVNPLPEGSVPLDILEAGWNFSDAGKLVVFGAVEPQKAALVHEGKIINAQVDAGVILSAQNLAVADLANQDKIPSGYSFPFGVQDLTVTTAAARADANLTLDFGQPFDEDAVLFKIDLNGEWHAVSFTASPAAGTAQVALIDGDAVSDLDGVVNGEIIDPIVLALPSDSGDSGCVLAPNAAFSLEWLLVALFPALALIRRRKR